MSCSWHEVVKVGNAQYFEDSGRLSIRVTLDTLVEGHEMTGRAIEIGLIEAFHIKPIVSERGRELTEEVVIPQPYESVDGVVTLEESADEIEGVDGTTHSDG